MKQSDITRRRFLKASAGTIGAMLLADTATAAPVKAKTRKSDHWSSKGPVQISTDDGTNSYGDDLNQQMFYTSPRPWVFDIPKMFSNGRRWCHHSPPCSLNDGTLLDLAQI